MRYFTVTGTIKQIFSQQDIKKNFSKREFTFLKNPYKDLLLFTLINEDVDMIDKFNRGELVTIDFDIRCNPWKNKHGVVIYFTTLQVIDITAGKINTPVHTNFDFDSEDEKSLLKDYRDELPNDHPKDDLPF